MQTLRRYLFWQICAATALVLMVFVGLLFFLDMLNQLSDSGPGFAPAMLQAALGLPARAYAVFPIAALTGTVYVLASLAASSEFTVMRMSGLSPRAALGQLLSLGLVFAALVFALGEFVSPAAQRLSAVLQARSSGGQFGSAPDAGVWLRDRRGVDDDEMINIAKVESDGRLQGVHIYVLDARARLVRTIDAASGHYLGRGDWELREVTTVHLEPPPSGKPSLPVQHSASAAWQTSVSPSVLEALLLSPEDMSVFGLWRYIDHLQANGQAIRRDELELWRKLLYPLSAVIMMMLALPFAYLHARSGQISWKVFGGIMLGVSFILFNTLSTRLGLVASWPVWLTAALPYLLYGFAALGFFVWRVQRH